MLTIYLVTEQKQIEAPESAIDFFKLKSNSAWIKKTTTPPPPIPAIVARAKIITNTIVPAVSLP